MSQTYVECVCVTVANYLYQSAINTNIQLLRLRTNLQELPNRIDKSLVVMIAHPFDVLVVSFDTVVKLLHKLLMLVAIVNRSVTHKSNVMTIHPLLIIRS